jgi:hypothetical protein
MQTVASFPILPPSAKFDDDGRPRRANDRGPCPAGDYLKQFHEIETMIGLMHRLPVLADDIGRWRPRSSVEPHADAAQRQKDEILRVFDGFNPLMRRAFEAVAAGLGRLAQSAVDLCGHAHQPLTPDEFEACAAIGRSMRRLLERGAALVECANGRMSGATLAHGVGFSRNQPMRWPVERAKGAN